MAAGVTEARGRTSHLRREEAAPEACWGTWPWRVGEMRVNSVHWEKNKGPEKCISRTVITTIIISHWGWVGEELPTQPWLVLVPQKQELGSPLFHKGPSSATVLATSVHGTDMVAVPVLHMKTVLLCLWVTQVEITGSIPRVHLEVLAGKHSYWYTLDRRIVASFVGGMSSSLSMQLQEGCTWSREEGRGHPPSQPDQPNRP